MRLSLVDLDSYNDVCDQSVVLIVSQSVVCTYLSNAESWKIVQLSERIRIEWYWKSYIAIFWIGSNCVCSYILLPHKVVLSYAGMRRRWEITRESRDRVAITWSTQRSRDRIGKRRASSDFIWRSAASPQELLRVQHELDKERSNWAQHVRESPRNLDHIYDLDHFTASRYR